MSTVAIGITANVTQRVLAKRLGATQADVSKVEPAP